MSEHRYTVAAVETLLHQRRSFAVRLTVPEALVRTTDPEFTDTPWNVYLPLPDVVLLRAPIDDAIVALCVEQMGRSSRGAQLFAPTTGHDLVLVEHHVGE